MEKKRIIKTKKIFMLGTKGKAVKQSSQAEQFVEFRMKATFRAAILHELRNTQLENESNITFDFIEQKNRELPLDESFECIESEMYNRINEWLLNN